MSFHIGTQCKHQFCWDCLANYRTILELDNSAHAPTCRLHPDNLKCEIGYDSEDDDDSGEPAQRRPALNVSAGRGAETSANAAGAAGAAGGTTTVMLMRVGDEDEDSDEDVVFGDLELLAELDSAGGGAAIRV